MNTIHKIFSIVNLYFKDAPIKESLDNVILHYQQIRDLLPESLKAIMRNNNQKLACGEANTLINKINAGVKQLDESLVTLHQCIYDTAGDLLEKAPPTFCVALVSGVKNNCITKFFKLFKCSRKVKSTTLLNKRQ